MQGQTKRTFDFVFEGSPIKAVLQIAVRGNLRLRIHDIDAAFSWRDQNGQLQLQWQDQAWRCHAYANANEWHVFADAGHSHLSWVDPLAYTPQDAASAGNLAAPMPGKLLAFNVSVGDKVVAGQALAVMEAMKMEHTVAAPAPGTVAELLYAPGDQVSEGAPLLRLSVE
jgi:3-methylcrotonyl-CoA carboxylase alpha subunit